jgi:5-hydroxyisourate hydrolase-like protein (transthyretin family)
MAGRHKMKKILAVFLATAFVLLTLPVRDFAAAAPRGNGALTGHIFDEDMRTPVRDAVVKLRNVITQQEYESEPTDLEGMYKIPAIEEGRYVMGVQVANGSYNFHYSLMIKSNALAKLSVSMKPGSAPVRIEEGTGTNEKKGIGQFFKSPAGILTIITAVEVTLFAIALSEGEASPIID